MKRLHSPLHGRGSTNGTHVPILTQEHDGLNEPVLVKAFQLGYEFEFHSPRLAPAMKTALLIFTLTTNLSLHAFAQAADYAFQLPDPKAEIQRAQEAKSAEQTQQLRDSFTKLGAAIIRGTVLSVIGDNEAVLLDCPQNPYDAGMPWIAADCYFLGPKIEHIEDSLVPIQILGKQVLLILPKGFKQLTDNDAVNVVALQKPNVYHYTTTMGSTATVHVYWLGVN